MHTTASVCGRAGAVTVMPWHALAPEHVSVQSAPSGHARDSSLHASVPLQPMPLPSHVPVPAWEHTPLVQSRAPSPHAWPCAHVAWHVPPQSTSVSPSFCMPSKQCAGRPHATRWPNAAPPLPPGQDVPGVTSAPPEQQRFSAADIAVAAAVAVEQPGVDAAALHAEALSTLQGMGFDDRERNLTALQATGGNVEASVGILLNM